MLATTRRPVLSASWCVSEPVPCAALRANSPELVLLKDYLWYLRERELAPLEETLRREYDFSVAAEAELDRRPYVFYRLTRR